MNACERHLDLKCVSDCEIWSHCSQESSISIRFQTFVFCCPDLKKVSTMAMAMESLFTLSRWNFQNLFSKLFKFDSLRRGGVTVVDIRKYVFLCHYLVKFNLAVIASWIRLRLPYYSPRFKS